MRRRFLAACVAVATVPMVFAAGAPAAFAEPDTEIGSEVHSLAERLAAAAEHGAETQAELAAAVSLAPEGPGSPVVSDTGLVSVSVHYSGDTAAVRDLIAATDPQADFNPVQPSLVSLLGVDVTPELLDDIAELPGVEAVIPAIRSERGPIEAPDVQADEMATLTDGEAGVLQRSAEPCGAIPVEADSALRSAEARERFGVDGSGVKVGVISDSFDNASVPVVTTALDDVRLGSLPGAENPCGYLAPVEVLLDNQPGEDEGRAMAQLVHGIAPGATLMFAGGGDSEANIAASIELLAENGADIIVDDLGRATASYFQQGIVSAVYDRVREQYGVLGISASGNSNTVGTSGASEGRPITSWMTTAYRPMACPAWLAVNPNDPLHGKDADIDCLDFDPGDAELAYDTFIMSTDLPDGAISPTLLGSLGEPVYGVTTQYELRAYEEQPDGDPKLIGGASMIDASLPNALGEITMRAGSKVRLVMVRTGFDAQMSPNPSVMLVFFAGAHGVAERAFLGNPEAGAAQTDWVGPSAWGHNGDGASLSVAAVAWDDTERVREYSSLGPNRLLFAPVTSSPVGIPAARLPEPQLVESPHVASVDGTRTSFFGRTRDEAGTWVYRFYGTSAAAPNAAGVAALGYSALLGADAHSLADALREPIVETARSEGAGAPVNPYAGPGGSWGITAGNVTGAGLIDAVTLIERLQPPPEPEPEPGPSPGPGPNPGPDTSGGGGMSGSAHLNAKPLADTGGQSALPWMVGGGILLVVGAGTLIAMNVRRHARTRGQACTDDAHTEMRNDA